MATKAKKSKKDGDGRTKTVTVKFNDAVNGVEESTSFTVNVVKKESVAQFEQSGDITDFNSHKTAAGSTDYGHQDFSGQFKNKVPLYVIGDENEFKYVPAFAIDTDEGEKYQEAFYADVDIELWVNGVYVPLEKTAVTPTEYDYIYNGEAIARVDTYIGKYKFQKPLERVKISVLPSADYYNGVAGRNPATLEAKVIHAYNVHETWQLAVLDNDPSRTDWNDFKAEKGILGYDPAGIVLHADLHISKDDVPQSFFRTLNRDIIYKNAVRGETKTIPAGTKYLIDGTVLYSRQGAAEFVIEGNYFTIDLKSFPLVASPAVFEDEGYGADFSNAVFMAFELFDDNFQPEQPDVPYITINNIQLIGNAARDNWVDANEKLVTAGGVLMIRSSRYAQTTINNMVNNSFFISYFTDYEGYMQVNDSKCYDSYQNGAFVWADSVLEVNGSYINGSGGPMIISQSVLDGNTYYNPKTILSSNTVIESHLSGEELWFNSIPGVSAIIVNLKALGSGMQVKGLGNFVDANGKMNIKAILMRNGSDASALEDVAIQGTVMHGNGGIDRWQTSQTWGSILANIMGAAQNGNMAVAAAPYLTVYKDGVAYTVYLVESEQAFYDLEGRLVGTDPSHAALMQAFATADQIVLSQGGLSALLEFYHGADAYTPQIPVN